VANNPEFKTLADALVTAAATASGPVTSDELMALPAPSDRSRTCRDLLNDLVNKIRENMKVARIDKLQGRLASYVHFNGKVGVLLQVEGAAGNDELLADLCMHITAMKPSALSRDDVDAAVIEKEKEIAKALALQSGKPESIVEKIVLGKVNRWYSEHVLLEQEFANPDKFKGSISKLLAKYGDIKIAAYRRLEVGG